MFKRTAGIGAGVGVLCRWRKKMKNKSSVVLGIVTGLQFRQEKAVYF